MEKKTLVIAMIISLIVDIIILDITSPTSAGPIGVLAFFIFGYIFVLGCCTYLLYAISRIYMRILSSYKNQSGISLGISFRKAYYYSSIIALGLVMLLGMQSVSGVGVYEFLLVVFFVTVGCLYVSRRMA